MGFLIAVSFSCHEERLPEAESLTVVFLGYRLVVEGFADVPFLPDIANQIRPRFQGLLSWFPAGWSNLSTLGFTHQLECFDLANGFRNISSNGGSEDFVALNDTVGINDERPLVSTPESSS